MKKTNNMRIKILFFLSCLSVIFVGCNKSDCLSSASYISGFFQETDRVVSTQGSVYTLKLEGNADVDNAVLIECDKVHYGYLLLNDGQEVYRDTLGEITTSETTINKQIIIENPNNDLNWSVQLFITDCLTCNDLKGRDYLYDVYNIKSIEKWPEVSTPITSGIFEGIAVGIPDVYGNDSVVLVGLGENSQGGLRKSFWIFNGESWISNPIPNLPVALKGAVATYYKGDVFVGFGEKSNGFNDKVYRFRIRGGQYWEEINTNFPSFKNGMVFSRNNALYFGLGVQENGDYNSEIYELSIQNGTFYWTENILEDPSGGRVNALVYNQSGNVFAVGGSNELGLPIKELLVFDNNGISQTSIANYPNNAINPSGFYVDDRFFMINNNEENTSNFYEVTSMPSLNELGGIDFAFRRQGALSFSLNGKGYYGLGIIQFDENTKQYLNDVYAFIPF